MIFRRRSATEVKIPRLMRSRWILENQISTWFNQEQWILTEGCSSSQAFTVLVWAVMPERWWRDCSRASEQADGMSNG